MEVEVLDFRQKVRGVNVGTLYVKYHNLLIKCDLCVYKYSQVWVRMPEVWFTKDKKTSFCRWPNQQISDDFQKEVLKKTFAKYDLDTEKVIALCRNHRKRLETSPAFIS